MLTSTKLRQRCQQGIDNKVARTHSYKSVEILSLSENANRFKNNSHS